MKIIETEVEDFAPEPIVDVEVSNSLAEWKNDYSKSKISMVGIFHKNKIKQIVLLEDKEAFKDKIIFEINNLLKKHSAIFALNNNFEHESLLALTGVKFNVEDVRIPIFQRHRKDDLYNMLIQLKNCDPIHDPFNGDGGMCVKRYNEYIATKNEEMLQECLAHNKNCLLKENAILKNKDFFIKIKN